MTSTNLTIKEIGEYIASTENISKASADRIVRGVFGYIANELSEGRDVSVSDFGKFVSVETKARMGRNPATGESIAIESKRAVKFKPAKKLKDLLNAAV